MKKLMYILLSAEQYKVLNEQISDAMGFDVGMPTERYAPVIPMLAKVNIQFTEVGEEVNETFDTIPAMPITDTVQERFPQLLEGYNLIESYVPYVENVQL